MSFVKFDSKAMPPQENEADTSASDNPPGCPPGSSSPPGSSASPNWAALRQYLLANKIDSALCPTRVFTIISSVLYMLPFLSPMFSYNWYKRALISSVVTSALRLHQRLPRFQFSREYFGFLLTEDSCHYLLYSIMFMNSHPVTVILIPVVLFAFLHMVSFTKKLLDILGNGGVLNMFPIRSTRKAIDKVEMNQQGYLRFIACAEIILMPGVILMTLSGQAGIVIPFVYYRFLALRYASRRNPYSRVLFSELRHSVEQLASRPHCPGFLRTLVFKFTASFAYLAPPQMAPPPEAAS